MTVDRFGNRHAPNLPYGAEDKIRAEGRIHQGNLGPLGSASAALQENEDANPGTEAFKRRDRMVRRRPSLIWQKISLIRRFNSLIRAN